ncbi:polyprenyl diphosphate synthase [Streptomyces sp. SID13031]|uniref:polyprenyl diphosphate synthase n=1 Tax=Streptomyces sp. SID13031 TaxID=2706046 RepID=UPI0013C92601|nr:polyprenyl diphosphate synthase [Streptomyces sp. SID13031]NEA37477.1 di-trans,poly-cis-decaprenylcistransferase [Streptomyces sp. SID13031]
MRMVEPDEAAAIGDGPLPVHVAIVMDGNGRWATYQGLDRTKGHFAAKQPAFDCINLALDLGIPWLSIYAFSLENWTRPAEELDVLLSYPQWAFTRKTVDSLKTRGVRFHFIGDLADERVPPEARAWFTRLEQETSHNDVLELVVAFNYSGRTEIVEAARRAILAGVAPEDLDVELLSSFMHLPNMPPVDLLIRTSGEQRISNFLLWHIAYSEFVFFDTLWPDFKRGHFQSALAEFQVRHRRYGGLPWLARNPATRSQEQAT